MLLMALTAYNQTSRRTANTNKQSARRMENNNRNNQHKNTTNSASERTRTRTTYMVDRKQTEKRQAVSPRRNPPQRPGSMNNTKHPRRTNNNANSRENYYVSESVGIACGFLLAAIHNAGLCALTHTPSPMGFLSKILNRPENERPFLLIPVGYPTDDVKVPDLKRKGLAEISKWY